GSVKSNIGHTLTAAGSAGLLKVLLALQERTLPPTANFSNPVPALADPDCPLHVFMKPEPWDRRQRGRRLTVQDGASNSIIPRTRIPKRVIPRLLHRSVIRGGRPVSDSAQRTRGDAAAAVIDADGRRGSHCRCTLERR